MLRKRPRSRVGESENTSGTTNRREIVTQTQYFLLNSIMGDQCSVSSSLLSYSVQNETMNNTQLCVVSNEHDN